MSPEAEAQKVIAISFGKIASSRVQRGGPKLCKNLLVANLIHKARTFVDDNIHIYHSNYNQVSPPNGGEMPSSVRSASVQDRNVTEVFSENGDMTAGKDRLREDCEPKEVDNSSSREYDDKENDSPVMNTDCGSDVSRIGATFGKSRPDPSLLSRPPSRCLKRRNCSEGKTDYQDTHRSPSKRTCDLRSHRTVVAYETPDNSNSQDGYDSESDFPVDGMDVEQISTLVSAFSNSFREFSCVSNVQSDSENATPSEKTVNSSLWRSNSVPDMVFCAQQATSVLKMRQPSFETSSPVLA